MNLREYIFRKSHLILSFVCILFILGGCSVSRNLNNNQKLLLKHKITIDNKKIDKDEMLNYVKPKPNRSFLGFHTRLYFYYTFKNSEHRLGIWMRDIVGEKPVLLDTSLIKKNEDQLNLFLHESGYYNSHTSSTIKYKGLQNKKAIVGYNITSGNLYTISDISYQITDSAIAKLIEHTKHYSKLKSGKPFAINILQEEQNRLVKICNNSGYYEFTKDNIFFAADTTHGFDSVSVVICIKKTTENSLKKHRIKTTTIDQNYKQKPSGRLSQRAKDSLNTSNYDTTIHAKSYVKPETIQLANFIQDDEIYRLSNVEHTRQILSNYSIFKLVNIEFKQLPESTKNDTIDLECFINISPEKRQSINIDIEGTNTSGDWGAEINTSYTNRNLFHNAEYFNIKLKLATEYNNVLKTEDNNIRLFNSQEYGIAADFSSPMFLAPFYKKEYNKKFLAKTNCHAEYNFLQTPDYTRPTTQINIGYTWYGNKFLTYNLNPIDFSYIRYYDISERFNTFINSRNYYKYSYEDYLLYCNNFTLTYYNKRQNETRDYQYLRIYTETSGNLMYLYCNMTDKNKNTINQYETFNLPFAQYVKGEVDFRYYDVLSPKTTLVYRAFGGISIPYLNSNGLPSVKKYYAGGANSMRAWESRSLGLGSHIDTVNTFKYYTGDVKLELNLECRFHLFWILDGAAFVDVGNIWSFWNDELDNAEFHFKDFYKDLAVGTGFGLRFDFSFLIVRCDMGMKVREPYIIEDTDSHLIWGSRAIRSDDFNINIGIGYPF